MQTLLRGLLAFAQVVESRSFSGAASTLGVTKSAVSKLILGLEAELGVQLLVRTTRKLALTEVGERVYAACARLQDDVEAARQAAASHRAVVVGHMRVTAPAVLGRDYLVPVITDFLALHPQVTLELDLSDRFVDLVDARIDVAIRVGRMFEDSTLVVRKIAEVPLVMCAAPKYLAQRGTPRSPSDLDNHELVLHKPGTPHDRLVFRRGQRSVEVRLSGRFACNDGAAMLGAAALGQGLVVAPEFELFEAVASKKLVRVLDGWKLDSLTLNAVFPPQRHVSTKARAFVDHLVETWKVPPWRGA